MKTAKIEKIENFLKGLSTDIDLLYFVDIEEINFSDAYQSIYDMIEDNGGFNIDIIYYSNAIDYLQKNDPSLHESLGLASDFGFDIKKLNSEILASLLASEITRNEFTELENEINDFFEELEEEEEEEEDEEE